MRGKSRLAALVDRLQPSEPVLLALTAVAVGLASGAGVWGFKALVELVQDGSASLPPALPPIAGGMLVVADGSARAEVRRLCRRAGGEG